MRYIGTLYVGKSFLFDIFDTRISFEVLESISFDIFPNIPRREVFQIFSLIKLGVFTEFFCF